MPDDISLSATINRVRRVKAGERQRTVYDFEDEEMDDFMYRMLENKTTADLQRLADVCLAERDETPLDRPHLIAAGLKQDEDADGQLFQLGLFAGVWRLALTRYRDGWGLVVDDPDGDHLKVQVVATVGQFLALMRGLAIIPTV